MLKMNKLNLHQGNIICYIPYIKAVKRLTRKKRVILECCIDGRIVTCVSSGSFDSLEHFDFLFYTAIERLYSEEE
jgi:hypothetical protein